jgi:hypothetical protein
MPPVEMHRHKTLHKERRAKPARRSFALTGPKPLLRSFHHPDGLQTKTLKRGLRVCAVPISNGAKPVAFGFGHPPGATPDGRTNLNMPFSGPPTKQDISTLPGLGHFYFALTKSLYLA